MGGNGIGPLTSSLSETRSTTEPTTLLRRESDSNRRMAVLQTAVLTASPSRLAEQMLRSYVRPNHMLSIPKYCNFLKATIVFHASFAYNVSVAAPLSIIIPTLNEEKYLPKLLDSIKKQTLKPHGIIVADALSKDKTREVAKTFGCKIVHEKPPCTGPGKGRNTGEKVAEQKLLLFLDSDVILPQNFLEKALREVEEKNLDIATCFVVPLSESLIYKIGAFITNYYFLLISNLSPHAGGYCIFIKKEIHDKIRGFDETLILGEDHDYVERASKLGKFGFIRSVKIQISIRRLAEEGAIKTFCKYLLSEVQTLIFGKQKTKSFGIEFGKHHKE